MSFTVHLVDDDPAVLRGLTRLLHAAGHDVRAFPSARSFLDGHDPALPGCVVCDVAMPDIDGLELQAELTAAGVARPIIFITGFGDVSTSVSAMKAGAVDFLTKPVHARELLDAIDRAAERERNSAGLREERAAVEARLATLTAREREVLMRVIAGRLNKQIAEELGTVEKTVKVHRGRMMTKMGVRSVADLVRMTERAGILPANA